MALDVPVRMRVSGVVLLLAADLDLLEAPLRQDGVRSAQVASQHLVAESHASSQRMDVLNLLSSLQVVHDLDDPVVLFVADGRVTVARNFVVQLRDRGGDGVGVQIASRRSVLQTNDIAILKEADWALWVIRWLIPSWKKDPIVVVILIMITSDLLLSGAGWVRLDVRMEETTAVADILQRDF